MTPKRWIIGIGLLPWMLAIGGVHGSTLPASGVKSDQMEKIETDLRREREQYAKFNEREKELLDHLSRLESEIGEKRKSLAELQEKTALTRDELQKMQGKLKQTEKTVHEVEGRLARRMVAFYKHAKLGIMGVLASSTDLDDLAKKVKYLRIITSGDRRLLQETGALQQRHRQDVQSVKEKLSLIERMEKEEGIRVLSMKEDLDRKVLIIMKIHKEREFYETAVKELELAAHRLRETLLHLEKTEIAPENLPTAFQASKGRLPSPCAGKILRGDSPGGENVLKGVYIEPRGSREVRAVFSGRVDYSGILRGYGDVIVINHGTRFFTVSAYLSRRSKEAGAMVNAGDVIGLLAEDGSGSGGRLYFEIRKGGVSVDPLEWIKPN